jgi:tetratricopeptide (TPR) repeat protein
VTLHAGFLAYLMRMPSPIVGLCALGVAVTAARTACAQSANPDASALYAQSATAYKAGHFAEAASLLQRAYELSHAPVLLYNLARAYEGMGAIEDAASAYERYLDLEPNPPDRGAIQTRIATLRNEIEERRVMQKQRDEERARAERERAEREARDKILLTARRRTPSALPWIVAGFGVVAGVGTGVGLGEVALSRHSDAEANPQGKASAAQQGQAQTFATGADIAFVSGGVVAAAGIVWGIVDVFRGTPRVDTGVRPGARVDLSPMGATLRGSF